MQLIAFVDVEGEFRMFEDGWKGYEMVGWCGGILGGFWWLPRGFHQFGLKIGHFRKTYMMY